jgi:EAL domain-containing protein (putative c-di-GMP-specific phosphodiesterase class I)/FixJ family two-component response regulator
MTASRIRILVAEDDASMRAALTQLISAESTLELVAIVADAEAAVAAAGTSKPDVALIDVNMPGGGGQAAARGIRKTSPATKLIALTAHDDRATVLDMLEAGALGYIVKGGPIDEIVDSIVRVARGQASLSVQVTADVIDEVVEQRTLLHRDEERARRRRARIERALSEPDAVHMVFQPICRLADGEIVGAEALARFSGRPRRPPDQWFAEAREVGLHRELELLAVRQAVEQLPELGDDRYLTLNVSPSVVAAKQFKKIVADQASDRIVVEVTEHAPIANYDRFNSTLADLRTLGARVAIDDAGAGFASLRHILMLGPEFIKLDQTLIQDLPTDRSRQALAAGLISFAEKAQSTIIAEGIEAQEEVDALRGLGVEYGQGFFFALPGPLPLQLSPGRLN